MVRALRSNHKRCHIVDRSFGARPGNWQKQSVKSTAIVSKGQVSIVSMFKVAIGVSHPDSADSSSVSAVVDANSVHSVLPASLLKKLGISPRQQVVFTRFDGSEVECGYGLACFSINGEEWPCPVVFGPENDYRLGASALEIFNLEVDHVGAKLRPAKRRFLGGKAQRADPDAPRGAAAILQMFKEIHESMPEGALDELPTDLSVNFKHYLYGWPKEVE